MKRHSFSYTCAGKNVLVDGSLRDSDWYKLYFQILQAKYVNLKIAILHIVAPREAVLKRASVSYMLTRLINECILFRAYNSFCFFINRTARKRPVESFL